MAHIAHRPTPARRLFDFDYGAYTGNPDDPRYAGPMQCPECLGCGKDGDGEKCPDCDGDGTYWEDG